MPQPVKAAIRDQQQFDILRAFERHLFAWDSEKEQAKIECLAKIREFGIHLA